MAEFKTNTKKSKNQFTARLVSAKTGAMISWAHITDDFARKVFGAENVAAVTPMQAETVLPTLLSNEMVTCVVTDIITERAPIDVSEY